VSPFVFAIAWQINRVARPMAFWEVTADSASEADSKDHSSHKATLRAPIAPASANSASKLHVKRCKADPTGPRAKAVPAWNLSVSVCLPRADRTVRDGESSYRIIRGQVE
jgi:hypothetical protein